MRVGILVEGVHPQAGGMTGAVYKRARSLVEAGHEVTLITFAKQASRELYGKSVAMGRAVPVRVENLWRYVKELAGASSVQVESVPEELSRVFTDASSATIEQSCDDGATLVWKFRRDKPWRFRGHDQPFTVLRETWRGLGKDGANVLTERAYFDASSMELGRSTTVGPDGAETSESSYIAGRWVITKGRTFLKDRKQYRDSWFEIADGIGGRIKLANYYDLQQHLIEAVLPGDDVVIFAEDPRTYTAVSRWDTGKRIFVAFHSTHLDARSGKIKAGYNNAVAALGDRIEGIIVLTRAAKVDLDGRVPAEERGRIHILQHSISERAISVPFEDRPARAFVSLGRLDPDKRVDSVIEAFCVVLKQFPDARLDIYGGGPDESRLRQLVVTLGVDDSVTFRGFVSDVDTAFQNATAHVFASRFEGFGLTLLESMANGTPNVAFRVPYGPMELVQEEFLVADGDTAELARVLMGIASTPENRADRARAAWERSKNYSDDKYAERLGALMNDRMLCPHQVG